MTTATEATYRSKRAEIDAAIAAHGKGIPADARRVMEQAQAIIDGKDAGLAELIAKRNELDAAFQISASDAAARRKNERQQETIALLSELTAAEEQRLLAVERMEAATLALVDAFADALDAAKCECQASVALVGAGISNIDQIGFANRLANRWAALMARALRTRRGDAKFGFVAYPTSPYVGTTRSGEDKEIGWKAWEAAVVAPALEIVRNEVLGQ
jgi:hypothetical protein